MAATKQDLFALATRIRVDLAACSVLAHCLASEAEQPQEYHLKEAQSCFNCAVDDVERVLENLHHA